MTELLSPAAQAVLTAVLQFKFGEESDLVDFPRMSRILGPGLAAVLRAAADQVVPLEVSLRRGMRPGGTGSIAPDEFMQDQRAETRRRLIGIAFELEAQP